MEQTAGNIPQRSGAVRSLMQTALLTLLAALSIAAGGLRAQTANSEVDLGALALDPEVVQTIRRDPEGALEGYLARFFRVAPNGSVTRAQLELFHQIRARQGEAEELARLMSFDLDGDLVIEEQEIDRLRPVLGQRRKAQMLTLLAYGDTNDDRRLSFSEVSAYVARRAGGAQTSASQDRLMQFDLDRDGTLIAWEIIQIVKAVGARGGGFDRPLVLPPTPERDGRVQGFGRCGYGNVPRDEHVVLVTAEIGAGLSAHNLARPDEVTTVSSVVIEKGRTPVTVMLLNNRPMVWRLRGQVERVRQVIISGEMTGVIGVPDNRLRIARGPDCLPRFFSLGAADLQDRAERQLKKTFPGTRLTVLPQRRALPIVVPSGQAQPFAQTAAPDVVIRGGYRHLRTARGLVPVEGPDADPRAAALFTLNERVRRQYPTGLHRVSDRAVSGAASGYRVAGKPAEMGLIDAIEDGQLEPLAGQRYRITPSFIRFPDGLRTGRFVLPTGVRMPLGLHIGLEVREERSGACLAGSSCDR